MTKTLLRSLCAIALLLGSSAARAEDPPADADSPRTVRVPWRKKPAQGTPDLPPLPKAPEQAPKVVDDKAAAEKAAADKAAAEAWAAQALAEEERAAAAEKAKKQKREEADRAAAASMAAAPRAVASAPEPTPTAPVARPIDNPAFVTTSVAPAPVQFNAAQAAWHSALLPGWGQIRTDRPYRGYAFAGAAGISLISAVVLTARASQANNIYQSAPPTVHMEAYNQARSYANARNALWATTAIIWGLNVAEAYFLYGTRDR